MGRLGSFRIYLFAQLNGMIKDIELVECSGAYMEMLLIVF